MPRHAHDVVIVGAGSGGYAAARTVRDTGCDAALVDHGPLGGLCILRGCMPSKALLASSDALHRIRASAELGVHVGDVGADMPFIAARKRRLVREFADYRIEGIETFPLYRGHARFLSPHELAVGDDTVLRAEHFVIATGSTVAPPRVNGLADAAALDSDAILELEAVPQSAIVLGGGYTACELGQFLARLGARTTMLIRSGHLLTESDDDVGEALTGYFREEGIDVRTGTRLIDATRRGERRAVRFAVGDREHAVEADAIFNALGRVPNVAGLDLERAGVALDARGAIAVDASLRTSNPAIYAVGDVTGEYMLVHVAIYQGEVAARNICLRTNERAVYSLQSAHAVFTDPQVAIAGATEKDLRAEGRPYVVGRYDFAEHGKAMCLGETKGFVKLLAAKDGGRILGGAVIGAQGSELIHEVIVAMNYGATVAEFMRIPHLHPTLAEIWTYPAEQCAEGCGMREPGDDAIEVATSGA